MSRILNFGKYFNFIVISLSLLLILLPTKIFAEEFDPITGEALNQGPQEIENGSQVCNNTKYILKNEGNSSDRIIYILNDKRQLLKVEQTNSEETILIFPENVSKIILDEMPINTKGNINYKKVNEYKIDVENCQGTDKTSKYKVNLFQGTFSYEDNNIIFKKPANNIEGYNLNYQYYDGMNNKDYNFDANEKVKFNKDAKLQLTELYNKNGKTVKHKYEMQLINNKVLIREVSSFDVKNIDFNEIVDFKYIIIALILLIAYIYFLIKRKQYKNKYRRYLKKKIAKKNQEKNRRR